MNLVHTLAKKLTRYPQIKRSLKNLYSYIGDFLSDKKTDLQGLVQISSNETEHNFGYYDKCPWSKNQRYMIFLAPRDATHKCVSQEATPIVLYDCASKTESIIAETHVWNSQQGCMLQWLGPDFCSRIIYNDFRDSQYCSVIYNLLDGSEQVLHKPVYTVSSDGKTAVTLDFSRLNTFGKGYGYCNIEDQTAEEKYPDISCMWILDIDHNVVKELPFTYEMLKDFKFIDGMELGYHKINHIMLNPSANRIMFIHRWIINGVKHHRLLTCNIDGSELYVLLDDGMVSHNNWKDDNTIISYCFSNEEGDAYHLLRDKTQEREVIGKGILTNDGHPSYSPDGKYIITDTYPSFDRKQNLYLIRVEDGKVKKIGSIYSNVKYINEVRCDLHPRWNYNSNEVCIDGSLGEKRQVYVVKIDTNF